jgi:hypothetical protein
MDLNKSNNPTKGSKPKMRKRKLSCVNCQEALKQRDVINSRETWGWVHMYLKTDRRKGVVFLCGQQRKYKIHDQNFSSKP